MKSIAGTEAAAPPEDPALCFIRLELAPSQQRWIATLTSTGLAVIGVLATVTFHIPYPVLVFAGILLLTVPPAQRPLHQAVGATGAAVLGAVSLSCWRSPPTTSPGSTCRCSVPR